MDSFLLHLLTLAWTSVGAARRLAAATTDQVLAAAVLAWANVVLTSLILSSLHRLGDPAWFLTLSGALGLLALFLAGRAPPPVPEAATAPANGWLRAGFILTLAPLAGFSLAAAWVYAPDNSDSLAHHLPRALFYLGQGNLAHFDAADARQILLPFDYNLLQLLAFIHGAPPQCLNCFNLVAWAACGVALYRLARLAGAGANTALITSWLGLASAPVVAQAATTTPDLAGGAALLAAILFAVRWSQTRETVAAWLAASAAGLAAGSDLRLTCFLLVGGPVLAGTAFRSFLTARWRAWIAPAALAAGLGLAFAVINFTSHPGWFTRRLVTDATGAVASLVQPLWVKVAPPAALNEDFVGFGPVAWLFLAGALYCVVQHRRPAGVAGWCARLGLAGLAAHLIVIGGFPRARDLLPVALVLGPCVAVLLRDALRLAPRSAGVLLLAIIVATGWSASVYLIDNTSRPVRPLLADTGISVTLPPLPLALHAKLGAPAWINIDTDGADERLFPLMGLRPKQRFTAGHDRPDRAYHLISRASQSCLSGYENLDERPSYVAISFPGKPTAGVEYLGTIGQATAARDYYGIIPDAGQVPASGNMMFLLATLTSARAQGHPGQAYLRLTGLNPADRARVEIVTENADASVTSLATVTDDGETLLPPASHFRNLSFRVIRTDSGIGAGTGRVPYESSAANRLEAQDQKKLSTSSSLFAAELVQAPDAQVSVGEGLLPTEGPFPQWDLPYLRWQKQPVLRLVVHPTPGLARLKLDFSVRLHVRESADLEVYFNGQLAHHYRIQGQDSWFDQTLELSPRPGENVLEVRDATKKSEPDWQDYINRYPDVKTYLFTQGISLERGAREHYESNGRAEGRTLQWRLTGEPAPPPDFCYFMFRRLRLEGFRAP